MPAPSGVIVALLTPVDPAGRVDRKSLERLVESVIARGVTGVSPLGSTGEGYSLDLEQRLAVVDAVAGAVPEGTPVIPGVFAHNRDQAAAEISAYAERGATAVLVAPPCYYPLSAAEQEAYFSQLADVAELPVVLYNIPAFTKIQIAPAVAASLASHPRIAGLKDSGRDFGYATELLDMVTAADFSVLTGTDSMLVAYMLAGAQGTICASANLVPEVVAAVYHAVRAGRLDDALRHEARLREVQAACGIGTPPAAYKAALAAAGICGPWLVPPRLPLTEAETVQLHARITVLNVLS